MQPAIARHYDRETAKYANEARIHADQVRRSAGVCVSGLDPAPFRTRTERDLIAAAEASAAREAALIESAQGKAVAEATALRKKAYLLAQHADAVVASLTRADGSAVKSVERLDALLTDIKGDVGLMWCAAIDADMAVA